MKTIACLLSLVACAVSASMDSLPDPIRFSQLTQVRSYTVENPMGPEHLYLSHKATFQEAEKACSVDVWITSGFCLHCEDSLKEYFYKNRFLRKDLPYFTQENPLLAGGRDGIESVSLDEDPLKGMKESRIIDAACSLVAAMYQPRGIYFKNTEALEQQELKSVANALFLAPRIELGDADKDAVRKELEPAIGFILTNQQWVIDQAGVQPEAATDDGTVSEASSVSVRSTPQSPPLRSTPSPVPAVDAATMPAVII
jgi:hypothetical protein